jgi:hypothetical protein
MHAKRVSVQKEGWGMTKLGALKTLGLAAVLLSISGISSPAIAGFGHSSASFHGGGGGGSHVSSHGGGGGYRGRGRGYGYGGGGYGYDYEDPNAWGHGPEWGSGWSGAPSNYSPSRVSGLNQTYFPGANVPLAIAPHLEVKTYSWPSTPSTTESVSVKAQMLEMRAQPGSLSTKFVCGTR